MSNTWSRFGACVAAGVLSLSIMGCGAKLSGTVPVSGTVTYNGSPLAGAQVGFVPIDSEKGKPANGLTDAEGRFQLRTFLGGGDQASGILPGEYKVSISKYENVIGYDPATGQSKRPETQGKVEGGAGKVSGAMMAPPKQLVPAKYANTNTSGLTATIKSSGNEPLKFELTD